MRLLASLALAISMLCGPAHAQAWSGADLDRRPRIFGQGDVDFALSELCYPFILQGADPVELVRQRRLPRGFGSRGWSGGQPFYLVGQADVWVSFDTTQPGMRSCSIRIGSGDVERYRTDIEARLTTWPTPLSLAGYQYPPNTYASRTFLCGPVEGPHDTVLLSLGAPAIALTMTIARLDQRTERCDGVPMPSP